MSEQESDSKDKREAPENLLKWIIRYVLIPLTVAAIGGWVVLEAVNLEVAARNNPVEHSHEDIVTDIFATMTAVAPQDQPTPAPAPSSTPAAVPTATQEASLAETGEPVAEAPQENGPTSGQTAVCGQVPAGWQRYTVQPGNTLYSLAQQTGTTVAIIEQVNCLVGPLKAYEQIWLPRQPYTDPEPSEEEPIITVTAPGLPDLVNSPGNVPGISVSCPNGPGSCVTSVELAVSNVGSADADLFNVQVWLDPAQTVVLNHAVERLLPGDSVSFSLVSPPGGNCYDPNCTVCITVDSRDSVTEEDETNNQFCTTFPG